MIACGCLEDVVGVAVDVVGVAVDVVVGGVAENFAVGDDRVVDVVECDEAGT